MHTVNLSKITPIQFIHIFISVYQYSIFLIFLSYMLPLKPLLRKRIFVLKTYYVGNEANIYALFTQ